MIVLGVDPGKSGALALVDKDKIISIFDMPYNQITGLVDGYRIYRWISDHDVKPNMAMVEDVSVMTGKEGRVSMFNFGVSHGIVLGVIQSLNIPIRFSKPAVWKSLMGLSSDKNVSREKIKERFPLSEYLFFKKSDDGRAEAALLAVFGLERFK